jgi:hypothetical protein
LLSSRAPDRFIRPVITFVIFASGLKYAGLGTTALGWTLCAVVLAAAAWWLAAGGWRGGARIAVAADGHGHGRSGRAAWHPRDS